MQRQSKQVTTRATNLLKGLDFMLPQSEPMACGSIKSKGPNLLIWDLPFPSNRHNIRERVQWLFSVLPCFSCDTAIPIVSFLQNHVPREHVWKVIDILMNEGRHGILDQQMIRNKGSQTDKKFFQYLLRPENRKNRRNPMAQMLHAFSSTVSSDKDWTIWMKLCWRIYQPRPEDRSKYGMSAFTSVLQSATNFVADKPLLRGGLLCDLVLKHEFGYEAENTILQMMVSFFPFTSADKQRLAQLWRQRRDAAQQEDEKQIVSGGTQNFGELQARMFLNHGTRNPWKNAWYARYKKRKRVEEILVGGALVCQDVFRFVLLPFM